MGNVIMRMVLSSSALLLLACCSMALSSEPGHLVWPPPRQVEVHTPGPLQIDPSFTIQIKHPVLDPTAGHAILQRGIDRHSEILRRAATQSVSNQTRPALDQIHVQLESSEDTRLNLGTD